MISVTIAPHVDLTVALGVRVPSVVTLPWTEWPLDEDAPIRLAEVTIARSFPPGPAKPTFLPGPTKGLYDLPGPPKVAPAAPPVAPRAFVEWLTGQLPDRGPVAPTPADHPAHAALVAAYRARKITAEGLNAGSNFDLDWAVAGFNVDLATRLLALDDATVAALVGPPAAHPAAAAHAATVLVARSRGASRPGALRDEVLADYEAEQEAARKEAERMAAAKARETELLPVDLGKEGLLEVTTNDPRISFGRAKVYDTAKPRYLMRSHGILTGETALHIATRDGGVAKVKVRDTGTTQATRKELVEVGPLDDRIVKALLEERPPSAPRAAGDFLPGDVRTLEGRHALHLLRTRAAQLVHALATAPSSNREVGSFLQHLLLTIATAFGGAVALPVVVDVVQTALEDYVASKSVGRVYGLHGQTSEATPVEVARPQGLLKPNEVPGAMLRALAGGSYWAWGEAIRPPTPDEERSLRAELDPALWARTVEGAIAERTEVRSQDVYDALFAAGLTPSTTPNAEQRGRVSEALSRSGFTKVQVKGAAKGDASRHWVWRRPAPAVAQ